MQIPSEKVLFQKSFRIHYSTDTNLFPCSLGPQREEADLGVESKTPHILSNNHTPGPTSHSSPLHVALVMGAAIIRALEAAPRTQGGGDGCGSSFLGIAAGALVERRKKRVTTTLTIVGRQSRLL